MKKLLRWHARTTLFSADLGLLVLRLGLGTMMALGHGWGKITNLSNVIAFLGKQGYPLPNVLGLCAGLAEFVGALFVAIGLLTRSAALTVVSAMAVAAFVQHAKHPWLGKAPSKEMALLYLLGMAVIVVAGPGRFSLDRRLFG